MARFIAAPVKIHSRRVVTAFPGPRRWQGAKEGMNVFARYPRAESK